MAKVFTSCCGTVSSIPPIFTQVTPISVAADSRVTGLDYDPVDGKIYWVERDNNNIKRSNVDGTNQEDIATSAGTGRCMIAKIVIRPLKLSLMEKQMIEGFNFKKYYM